MTANNHSAYGPSAAHRWLACPGSIQAEAEMPPEKESPYAAEGSAAHALAEMCLRKNKPTRKFLYQVFTDIPPYIKINQEMVDNVQEYIDYVKALGGHQEYEQEVSYEEWVPGGYGTADAIVTVDDVLHVVDLKYGKGISVDADDNPQGKLYALGALAERESFQEFSKIVIHIFQPRLSHISVWETTPDELYKWAEWVKERAKQCMVKNPERVPGEKQCQWCRAKPTCYAITQRTEHALMMQFDELEAIAPTPAEKLRDSDLRFVLNHKQLIMDWLSSIEAHVKERLMNGEGFDGYKLVQGRSNRKWIDEADAEKKLVKLVGKDKAYTKKVISPAQAEKALGKSKKEQIADLIIKPDGAPTLVSEDDKRPACSPAISADDF